MGNGRANKGIRWMSWERLCTVKEEGGLGFKSLRSFNIAMIAKQAWRLITGLNPLVTRLMQARYFPDSDFFNAKMGSNPSYVWRSLLESQEVVRRGCRRRIGDGTSTKIWKIPWLPSTENGFLTTDMPKELRDATVAGLFDENTGGWDEEILNDIYNELGKNLIKQILISRREIMDSWFWMFDEHGKFTVQSCYRNLRGESECVNRVFWKRLWNLKLPGKVLNLVWRACRHCLPTTSALAGKGVNISACCSWCQTSVETDIHVLFQCYFAKVIWDSFGFSNLITVIPDDTVLTVLKRVF